MGVITNAPNGTVVGAGSQTTSQREIVTWKDFMKNSGGFTIAGSAASGVGGMDGVDRITLASFATNSWFVLEAPDSSYQLMLSRVGSGSQNMRLFINIAADWTGGSFGIEPTSPSNSAWFWGQNFHRSSATNGIIYCSVEDQPPYRFFFIGTGPSDSTTTEGGICLVTFTDPPNGSPNYGLIFCKDYFMTDWRNDLKVMNLNDAANFATRNMTNTSLSTITANYNGTRLMENGATSIVENYKFSIGSVPAAIQNFTTIPASFYGQVEWIKVTGYNQVDYQLMDDAEFISFGNTLFPWNGVAINKAKFS